MMEKSQWKRYWCPRIGSINLSDGGFLVDPNSESAKYYNLDYKTLEELIDIPCLILLGEPGMGKSTVLNLLKLANQNEEKKAKQDTLWLDLRSIGSEERLVKKLFEAETFQAWLKGDGILSIFLDSLDECLMRIDTVAALLADELQGLPIERLSLCIACRTADWPLSLEQDLKRLWGENLIGIYELTPLRRLDVIDSARVNDVNPDDFLREIERVEAIPLAIKPVTLSFLLNSYKQNQGLPSSQLELYKKGCQLLCEETNDRRRDSKLIGKLTSEQRMIIAARIAAITILSNKYAVWTGLDYGDTSSEDIILTEITGGIESSGGVSFEVSESAVRETLGTGLFSSRGPNRMGWAHQTYAEYLAARYLTQNEISIDQILSLIRHSSDSEGKIIPQLYETTAWLACLNLDVFFEVMKTDPDVLLRSDITSTDPKIKAALVESLLRFYEEEKLGDFDLEIRKRYKKLNYRGLAEQLRPYISDINKGIIVRRAAIDIAEDCGQVMLIDDLIKIALNQSETYQIRVQATCSVYKIGDSQAKFELVPLAKGQAGEDPDDELKGYSLLALWPDLISTKELFEILQMSKRENYLGSYNRFLYSDFTRSIPPDDMAFALHWVQNQEASYKLAYGMDKVIDAIMFKAWDNIENPRVLDEFVSTAILRLENHDVIAGEYQGIRFDEKLKKEVEKRRTLIKLMLPLLNEDKIYILSYPGYLILSEDLLWMLVQLEAEKTEEFQRKWSVIISYAFDQSNRIQIEALYKGIVKNEILVERFGILFEPVVIHSSQAVKMRDDYMKRQEWQNPKKKILTPPPAERMEMLLNKFESGDLSAWWQLNREMTLEEDSEYYGDELESDLLTLPGWEKANMQTRVLIINAAKRYLREANPEPEKWLGTNTFFRPAAAGYRALRLLFSVQPEFLESIPSEVWIRWAPLILAYPTSSGIGDEDVHAGLVKKAYSYASKEVIDTLITLINKENDEGETIFITRKVKTCWDSQLEEALIN